MLVSNRGYRATDAELLEEDCAPEAPARDWSPCIFEQWAFPGSLLETRFAFAVEEKAAKMDNTTNNFISTLL
jgi:hypothetical protein